MPNSTTLVIGLLNTMRLRQDALPRRGYTFACAFLYARMAMQTVFLRDAIGFVAEARPCATDHIVKRL